MPTLAKFSFSAVNAAADLRGQTDDFAPGSVNLIPLGLRQYRPFRNLLAAGNGARRLFQVKDTYGGLDDATNAATGLSQPASGSLFSSIAETLFYIGHGQVSIEGANIPGAIATSLLRILLKWNGSYSDVQSGPFVVGLPEPSAPVVGVLTTTAATSGTYSFRYARLRELTGGKSRASAISAVITLTGKGAYAVVPLPSTGQTRHIFFVTTRGLGGIGLHFRIPKANPYTGLEYTEEDVSRAISTLVVTNGSAVVTNGVAVFTAADVGKRFDPVSAGFTVPNPTTVLSVASDGKSITLSNPVTATSGANPRTANLISFVNNIDRAVIIDWQESDLAGEAAEISWIYDFPPPAGSHAFQMENRLAVVTYADSKLQASATNAGTAVVFSLSNQLESFDLRYPLYLPAQLVDVLGRGIDSYSFIGCRNGIYAVQYINSDTIPATISVLLPNNGIATPNNWAISKRALYLCIGDGKLTRLIDGGQEDAQFYEPIRRYIRRWLQAETVICNDPKNDGVMISNGAEAFYFDEQTSRWSTALDLTDTPGLIISGIGARSELLITKESGGVRTNYKFDRGTSSYVVGTSAYIAADGEFSMNAQRISAELIVDQTARPSFIALQKNNLKTFATDGATTAGSDVFTSTSANFTSEYLGHHILIRKAKTGNAWLWARIIQIISPTQVRLGTVTDDLSNSVSAPANLTTANVYALIGFRFFPIGATRPGTIQAISPELFFNNLTSIGASVLIETNSDSAQPLNVEIMGDFDGQRWDQPSAVWFAT